jgi:hypothetical protein
MRNTAHRFFKIGLSFFAVILLVSPRPVAISATDDACPTPVRLPPPAITLPSKIESDFQLIETLSPQILAFLNTTGSTDDLVETLDAIRNDFVDIKGTQVFHTDITWDDQPDVVVSVNGDFGGGVEGAILAYGCEDGAFVLLGKIDVFGMGGDDAYLPQIIDIVDMDGRVGADIVHSYVSAVGRGMIREIEIHWWTGYRFDILAGSWQVWAGNGTVTDRDEDGTPELVLTSPETYNPEFDANGQIDWRQTETVWQWLGGVFIAVCERAISEPDFRFEAVENGDDNLLCGFYNDSYYDIALGYFQRVINDETLLAWPLDCRTPFACATNEPENYATDPAETPRLVAYARYRMMQIYLALGETKAAQTAYNTLQADHPSGSPGYPYVELATIFWNSAMETDDLGVACEQTLAYSDEHRVDLFILPDIYQRGDDTQWHGYFDRFIEASWQICTFR